MGIGVGQAQCPRDTTFTLQAQIDSFALNYPTCTQLNGNLTVKGPFLTDLAGLAQLEAVRGRLTLDLVDGRELAEITNLTHVGHLELIRVFGLNSLAVVSSVDSLEGLTIDSIGVIKNLSGLEHIRSLPRGLIISNNTELESLRGIDSIDFIGQELVILRNDTLQSLLALQDFDADNIMLSLVVRANKQLTSLAGLEGFQRLRGNVDIIANNQLGDLSGLQNLTRASRGLQVSANASLANLTGLENFESTNGSVTISGNPNMTSLRGLSGLNELTSSLVLSGLPRLTRLDGLSSLDTIGQSLVIIALDSLSSLLGLESVDYMGGMTIFMNPRLGGMEGLNDDLTINGALTLRDNNELRRCAVKPICRYLESKTGDVIQNNQVGCNSRMEVEMQCDAVGTQQAAESRVVLYFSSPSVLNVREQSGQSLDGAAYRLVDLAGRVLVAGTLTASQQIDVPAGPAAYLALEIHLEGRRYSSQLLRE